ncbi:MAG TPA: glycosyltransferase family 2 protein [Patescibacteria group bacterium]|nr:glycosyltransferase family 2 protein [Patescibacteria group bacterium]
MSHFVLPRLPAALAARPALRLSVVVPAFNEQEVIGETHRRLRAACVAVVGEDFEIVYVNDGSRDRTWAMLNELAAQDANVVAVGLSRNFGHQLALSAGLELCRGERILMIDADLQDPPELLGEMMAKIDAGADIVYGKRTERLGETAFKRGTAAAFYRLLDRLTDVDIPTDTGDFRLVTRPVLEALRQLPESHRFVRGLFAWLGFNQVALPYIRQERFAGETKYPLKRMLRLAIDAITGFSTVPLRAALWLAIVGFVVALAVGAYALGSWLFFDTVRGWASIVGVIALFASAQLLCLGILGEYIGRMFMQAKGRPLAIVSEVVLRPRDPQR